MIQQEELGHSIVRGLALSEKAREEARLIPSIWRIRFVGDYKDFEIDVNAETGGFLTGTAGTHCKLDCFTRY